MMQQLESDTIRRPHAYITHCSLLCAVEQLQHMHLITTVATMLLHAVACFPICLNTRVSQVRLRGAQIIALFFICAFGSSLDVAAIQGESPEPLDFNHELQTVGASPFASLTRRVCPIPQHAALET